MMYLNSLWLVVVLLLTAPGFLGAEEERGKQKSLGGRDHDLVKLLRSRIESSNKAEEEETLWTRVLSSKCPKNSTCAKEYLASGPPKQVPNDED